MYSVAQTAASRSPVALGRPRRLEAWLFGLGIIFVPVSIAVTECLLAGSLVLRIFSCFRGTPVAFPRIFRIWLVWAGIQLLVWLHSPSLRTGFGEIRHQLLIAALFFLLPAIESVRDRVMIWRGVFACSTVNALAVILHFLWRLRVHPVHGDPVVYLRSGGLLHHWAVFSAVEIVVFGGLLPYWRSYREHHSWLVPVLATHSAAIVLSLTRMLWISAVVVLLIYCVWNRSRWVWGLPLIPLVLFWASPNPVRTRVIESSDPAYY